MSPSLNKSNSRKKTFGNLSKKSHTSFRNTKKSCQYKLSLISRTHCNGYQINRLFSLVGLIDKKSESHRITKIYGN